MGSVLVAPAGTELEAGVGYTTEIAIVNSGCGGTRLGRSLGGAIPRERVLRLGALSFVRKLIF